MLLCVFAAALLYLWVATQAGNDIDAARRTSQAVADIGLARGEAIAADTALRKVFAHEAPTLVGTGSDYIDDFTAVSKYLTLAAENNAAGPRGTSGIEVRTAWTTISGQAPPILVSGDFMGLFTRNQDARNLLTYLASRRAQTLWVEQAGHAFSADQAVLPAVTREI